MTLARMLLDARDALTRAGVEDASLEAEVLLRHLLGVTRARFYADLERPVLGAGVVLIQRQLDRLIEHQQPVGRKPVDIHRSGVRIYIHDVHSPHSKQLLVGPPRKIEQAVFGIRMQRARQNLGSFRGVRAAP